VLRAWTPDRRKGERKSGGNRVTGARVQR